MSAKTALGDIKVGDRVLAYIPHNFANPLDQWLHYEFEIKSISEESVTLVNFKGEEWTYSLSMLNMILLSRNKHNSRKGST